MSEFKGIIDPLKNIKGIIIIKGSSPASLVLNKEAKMSPMPMHVNAYTKYIKNDKSRLKGVAK